MEEKTGKADKKEIRSRKNQKLYRSRFGKGGKIMKKLEEYVRSIPDFPEPGIIFRDITTIL